MNVDIQFSIRIKAEYHFITVVCVQPGKGSQEYNTQKRKIEKL